MPTNSAAEQVAASSDVAHDTANTSPTSGQSATPSKLGGGSKNQKWKHYSPPPPTNCVVLKNLDYNITQDTLEEVVRRVTGGRKEFVNVSLVDDKITGTFRGMAFVNFHTTADATAALAELSKMVINGRKVFAEYRRLRPGEREKQDKRGKKFEHFNNQDRQTFEKEVSETDEKGVRVDKRAAFFAKRDTVKKADDQKRIDERAERDKEREAEFRKILLDYNQAEGTEGAEIEDLVFPSNLTSYERRMVHTICNSLDLGHISKVDEDGNRVLHVTKDPERKAEWDRETADLKVRLKKEEQQKRKNREASDARAGSEWKKTEGVSGGALTKEETHGIKWFKPRAALAAGSESAEATANGGIRAPSYKLYIPPRQPSGPDGTIGFASRCAKAGIDVRSSEGQETDVEQSVVDEEPGPREDVTTGDAAGKEEIEDKPNGKEMEGGKSSTHTVLNPSVPAFEPSFTQTY